MAPEPSTSEPARAGHFEAKLLDAVQQSVIATDLRGVVIFWNDYARHMFGWTSAEAIGRPIVELTPHESSREEANAIMQRLLHGQSWAGEFPLRRKDGSSFIAFVVNSPILDDRGKLEGIVGVSTDVSELRDLEARLRQATKMEAVGRLAGGVAHDFNNVLTVILGNTAAVLARTTDAEIKTLLQEVEDASLRAATLTRQLLTFSRKEFVRPAVIDARAALQAMTPMLRRLITEDIEIQVELGPGDLKTVLDASQFDQLILNLAVNGRDAMVGGGRLSLELAAVGQPLSSAARDPAGTWLRLSVRDTGCGVAPDAMPHLFEPFFSTKPSGHGTGLGLATVHGIVSQAGGSVEVESSPNGTVFHLFLPRATPDTARPTAPAPRPPAATAAAAGGGRTILLTEDEPMLRSILGRTLRGAGYEVLIAEDGHHALELSLHHEGPIDLLLTDVVMPGINGVVLAEHVRTQRPGIAVLLMTGYSENDVLSRGAKLGRGRILRKPFLLMDLLAAVGLALEKVPVEETASAEAR